MPPDEPFPDKPQKLAGIRLPMQNPLGVGLNCALGADAMRPYLQALSKNADCFVHCYPNAGLPNPLAPLDMTKNLRIQLVLFLHSPMKGY
jgi:hypothetical protein